MHSNQIWLTRSFIIRIVRNWEKYILPYLPLILCQLRPCWLIIKTIQRYERKYEYYCKLTKESSYKLHKAKEIKIFMFSMYSIIEDNFARYEVPGWPEVMSSATIWVKMFFPSWKSSVLLIDHTLRCVFVVLAEWEAGFLRVRTTEGFSESRVLSR